MIDPRVPCARCGATESPDGDWYRLCGACHWEEQPLSGSSDVEHLTQAMAEHRAVERQALERARAAEAELAVRTQERDFQQNRADKRVAAYERAMVATEHTHGALLEQCELNWRRAERAEARLAALLASAPVSKDQA